MQLSFNYPYSIEEYKRLLLVENYHKHTSFSNTSTPDSPVIMDDYVKREQELGAKCLFGGEHGNQGNFAENYFLAKKNNLKYVHSAEAYWVKNRHEKDRTNCHICIIALNNSARQELNYILSIANEDGYYGKPRIDLELILSLNPENFIITSACLQGWKYDDADEIWLKIANHFGTNFFLEVQNHNTEKQKELNRHILSLAKEYDLQIICGLDSHYISVEKDEERRNEYLKYKKMNYPEEDGWYLDYPDGKTIYKRFKEQGILSDEEILYSMMNTQVFNVKCEEIVIDNTFKIPILYKDKTFDERVQILKSHLNKAYKKEKLKSKEKIEGIKWETEQIVDSKVMDYFLTNEAIISDAINNEGGILTTTSRGSSASFIINKLLGFTTLDRFNSEIPIYPERFLTKERISAGQMPDIDFNVSSQEPFVRAAKKIVGENGCYPLMAVEKMSEKSAWQLYASVSGVAPIIANQISKYLDSYNETIKHLETEEEKKDIKVEDYIPKEYISIYNKSKEYQSIIVNLKVHACGFLLFDGDLRREFGLISAISQTTKKRTLCVAVEGKYLDDLGYVKNDFLIVDSVGVANECFQSIGQKVPTTEELKTLISKDNKTWQIYEYGITQCVNQVEQEKTKQKIVKYKPQTVSELAAFIAGIRPGFSSLLPTFLDRQYYSTGEDKIDEVLKDSYHYMIYQESIMKVLSFLQMPMASTYDVVKSISKKKLKGEKKEKLKNELKQSWMNIFGNTKNFEKIWQVINDAASYSFNSPHALSMAFDSLYLAYFKSHYTSKFYETTINHYFVKGNKDKINKLTLEAEEFYYYENKIPKFGKNYDTAIVEDDTKYIYPILSSIKSMQNIANDILYQISKKNPDDFLELLYMTEQIKVNGKKINKTSMEILIKLGFFDKFGDVNYLLEYYSIFQKYFGKTQVKKQDFGYSLSNNIIKKETEKTIFIYDSCMMIDEIMQQINIKDCTLYQKSYYQLKSLGYTDIHIDNAGRDVYMVMGIEKNKYGTPFAQLYKPKNGKSQLIKLDKKWYSKYPIEGGEVLRCEFEHKNKSRKDEKGNWYKTDEKEWILKRYSILTKLEE